MVQLVNGAGGHKLVAATSDPRVDFSLGKTSGILYLTLVRGHKGGTPTDLSWTFNKIDGTLLHSGGVSC